MQPRTGILSPPLVDAGPDKVIAFPANDITLFGHTSSSGGGPSTIQWTQTGGPTAAKLSAPWALATTVSFSSAGRYTFRLSVQEKGGSASGNTTITVLSASSQTAFYVDPTYRGIGNGTAAHPWTTLAVKADNPAWHTINKALESNNVIIYFSARQAYVDASEIETGEINIYRTDIGTNRLTLDGMSRYNVNDNEPLWVDNSGDSKFQIKVTKGSISIGNQSKNFVAHYTTIRGFDVSGNSGRILFGGNSTVLEYMHVHDITTIGSSVQFHRAVLADCSVFLGNLHDITIRNNTIERGYGEGIYIGSNYMTAGGCASWGNGHADILIEGNDISYAGLNGGQGDGIDIKAGVLNLTVRNNRIDHMRAASGEAAVGISADGVFSGVGNYLIENNRIFAGIKHGIKIESQNTTVIRNNLIVGNEGAGLSLTGSGARNNTNLSIYNNTIVGNGSVGVSVGYSENVTLKNNIFCGNNSGDGGRQTSVFNSANITGDYDLFCSEGPQPAFHEGPHSKMLSDKVGLFVDAVKGDFHLLLTSLAVAKGEDLSATGFSTDLEGASRQPGFWAIGAYEPVGRKHP